MNEDEPASNDKSNRLLEASSFVSKFDVLLIENGEGALEFWDSGHHHHDHAPQTQRNVGNNRFGVFCKMHLTEFQYAKTEQEEEDVLHKLYKSVLQQCGKTDCARSGKFLLLLQEDLQQQEQETEVFWLEEGHFSYRWTELPRERAYNFIRGVLELEMAADAVAAAMSPSPPPFDDNINNEDNDIKKRRRRSTLLRRSVSSGDMCSKDEKKRIHQRKSVLRQSTINLANFLEGVDFEQVSDDDDDDDHDGFGGNAQSVFQHSFPGVLPVSRPLYQRSGSWTADDDLSQILQTADPLDVILRLTDTSYELVPHHTGNNRVGVMIQLQASKYAQQCETVGNAHSVCQDLVDMVRANYGGKFLVQRDENDYRCLTDEQATTALDSIFRTEAGLAPTTAPKSSHNYNKSNNISRAHGNNLRHPLHPPTFSATIGSRSLGGGGDAHRTAREELQRRNKKKGLKTRLSNIVEKTSLGRAQSEGVGAGSSFSIPPPPQGNATRHVSTGVIGNATTAMHGTSDGKRPLAASTPVAGTELRDLFLEDDVQDDIEPLEPTQRRFTLSAFSQGMIQDMLSRLDVSRDEDDLNANPRLEPNNHTTVEAAFDALDFDLGPNQWDSSNQATADQATVKETADELDFQLTPEMFEGDV